MKKSSLLPLAPFALAAAMFSGQAQSCPNGLAYTNCAGCHSGGSFSYSGSWTSIPTVLERNATDTVTFSMSGSGASAGGFAARVNDTGTSGSLTATAGESQQGTGVSHSSPDTSAPFSWSFTLNAGSASGSLTLQAYGNPVDGNRTTDASCSDFTGTSGDGGFVNSTSSTVAINDRPTLSAGGGSAAYTEDGSAATVAPSLSLTDTENSATEIASGTVTITNSQTGDRLNISGSTCTANNLSCSGSGTSTITISGGPESAGEFQNVFRAITFDNTSNTPNTTNRTVQFAITDNYSRSRTSNRTVTVAANNDAPSISGADTTLAYSEGQGARTLEGTLSLSDVDSSNLNRATVTISNNYESGQDTLAVGNCAGLTCGFASGVLTISGTASVATYETALESVTFTNNSQDPSELTRTVSYQIRDSGNVSSSVDTMFITVAASDDPPSISGADTTLVYSEDDGAQTLEASVSISDVDSTQLNRAQIDLSTNYVQGEDVLAATSCAGLSCSFDAPSGTLTISGTATLAAYETAIESITYTNTSQNPSESTRTVRYDVRDTTNQTSSVDTMQITVARVEDPADFDSPVYNRVGVGTSSATSQTVIEDDTIQLQFAATDPEGVSTTYSLVSTTPTLTGPEPLITVSAAGLLEWTPDGTRNSVQAVVGVNDNVGATPDNTFTITLNVTGTNDPPIIAEGASTSVNMSEDGVPTAFSLTLNASDFDGDTITWSIQTDASNGSASTSGTGTSKAISYTPNANFNGSDSFVVRATDGSLNDDITVNVNIAAQPDDPVITEGASVGVNMSEDSTPTAFSLTLNATDPDGDTLTWSIQSNGSNGTASTSGTGNSKAITYNPNANYNGSDSFVVRVSDGARNDDITVNVTIAAQNDAPTINAISTQATDEFTAQNSTAALTVNVSGADIDGNSLSFSLDATSLAAGASISSTGNTTAQISYLPQTPTDNLTNVVVTVTDNQQVYAPAITTSFAINVNSVNDQPVIAAISNTSVTELSTVNVNIPATDEDDLTAQLTFGLGAGAPAGMSVNAAGQISWTPGENTANTGASRDFVITATAQDGLENNSVQQSRMFTITVNKLDTDADTIADYNDVCPNVSDVGQADNDSDWQYGVANTATTGGDACDTDDDNDGIVDTAETANGLDPFNAADAALDLDNDGLTNLAEYQTCAGLGDTTCNAISTDSVAPSITITSPATDGLTINSTGYWTSYPIEATATDALDGVLPVTADKPGPFRPGSHLITWSATDSSGNTVQAQRTLNVKPIVELSGNQSAIEGATVNVTARLNGEAAAYPVTVTYSLAGIADVTDTNLTNPLQFVFNTAPAVESTLAVQLTADGVTENNEELIFTLQSAGANAVVGDSRQHRLLISEGNLAPVISSMVATQNAAQKLLIHTADGNVQVTANATDPNGDTMTFDWSGSDAALTLSGTGNSRTFDPSGLTVGNAYQLAVTVSDTNGASSSETITLAVVTPPTLGATDTDGDGTNDNDPAEMNGDSDNDGIPNYLDAINGSNVITINVSNPQALLQSESGSSITVGSLALPNGNYPIVTEQQLQTRVTNYSSPTGTFLSSIINAEVTSFDGQSMSVVIPLDVAINADAIYSVLVNGEWKAFTVAQNDSISSATAEDGSCPAPGSNSYTSGLKQLANCIQVTISDGGANDADGQQNGSVIFSGSVIVPDEFVNHFTGDGQDSASSTAPATLSWLMLLLGLPLLILRRRAKTNRI